MTSPAPLAGLSADALEEARRRQAQAITPPMLGGPVVQPAPAATPTPAMTTLPAPSRVKGIGPLPGSPQDLNRQKLETVEASRPGYMDINIPGRVGKVANPILRGLAGIADVAGTAFLPAAAMAVPGSTLHHILQVNQLRGNERQYQEQQAAEDTQRLREAQAAEQESLPELNQAKQENAALKLSQTAEQKEADRQSREGIAQGRNETQQGIAADRVAATLRNHGWRQNTEGEWEPIPYPELPEADQISHDLKEAQVQVAAARRELLDAQAKNEPDRIKLAQQRVATAQQNANTAIQRVILSNKQFDMRSKGTDTEGNPYAGALFTDQGQPVGTAFQQNVRPTGQERNKADMAQSAHEQLGTLKDIVSKRPDIFGPASGRKTDFDVWLGSQDPDAQRFRAARTIAADHLAGTFGGRSEAALKALDDAIGQFKTNPKAVQAGLDQLEKGNQVFLKAGTVRTAGSTGGGQPPAPPTRVNTQAEYDRLPKGAHFIDQQDGKEYIKK